MIEEDITLFDRYPFGSVWREAFAFLQSLETAAETGRRILRGDDLYAGIDVYTTKAREAAKLETHRKYVDIQVLLSGTEMIDVYPKSSLKVSEPYLPERDAEFYHVPARVPPVRVTLTPGRFAVFFPEDAHMPCLNAGLVPLEVRKVVVKVALPLLPV